MGTRGIDTGRFRSSRTVETFRREHRFPRYGARKQRNRQRTNLLRSDDKKRNHILIAAITFVAIIIAETIVFIALQGATPNFWRNVMFCYGLPLPLVSIVAIVFCGLWANRILSFAAVSALIWTALADAFFIILLCGRSFPLVFVLGIPAEIVAMMSYKIKLLGKNKPEQK